MFHLQNMYEEGDEEMKKTIAKAWTDARSGKATDPLKRYTWKLKWAFYWV